MQLLMEEITNTSILRLTVAKFNDRAIQLYKNHGFIKQSEFFTERAEFITMIRNPNK